MRNLCRQSTMVPLPALPVSGSRRGQLLSMKIALGGVLQAGAGCHGCSNGLRVGRGLEQCLRTRFGCLPGVGLDECLRPALPRVVVLAGGCLDLGEDQLLDGAAAEEVAGLALGGQNVGAASDAELRCSRPGQPDAVPEADLVVGGQVDRNRLADAAGCRAEAACGDDPDGPAAAAAEGGKRVLDGCRG